MFFSAIGMKPPGFASAAPAPTTAIAGESATRSICAIMLAARFGSRGRRSRRIVHTSSAAPRTTSSMATQVFGLEGCDDAAAFPSTNAASTPIPIVAPNAPR